MFDGLQQNSVSCESPPTWYGTAYKWNGAFSDGVKLPASLWSAAADSDWSCHWWIYQPLADVPEVHGFVVGPSCQRSLRLNTDSESVSDAENLQTTLRSQSRQKKLSVQRWLNHRECVLTHKQQRNPNILNTSINRIKIFFNLNSWTL